ncbi:hypothetical protein PHISP_02359 [Aspergillus sp. HF37]|nr:hypothetical protein PHISP_02359 [Aspergillus sp. HF37]
MANTTSQTRLRQIALLVEDLSAAERLLTAVLGTEVIFRDARVSKWGLKNILVSIGGNVIEVLAPTVKDTTAGRLLQKRGDGGYMVIMQTLDASARKEYIQTRNLSRVIFDFTEGDAECVQYHPKGIPGKSRLMEPNLTGHRTQLTLATGGMMPELDSHKPSSTNPTPLISPFSPWHACGPDYASYSAAMSRCSHLQLLGADCRLEPGDTDTGGAARKWEKIFGVKQNGSGLAFTNSRLHFSEGAARKPEGLQSITVGVRGRKAYEQLLARARKEHVYRDGGVDMLGVKWYFVPLEGDERESRL